jgi:hypothetical protein
MKKTIVTNILTNEQYIYRNNDNTSENLACCILYIEKYNEVITFDKITEIINKYEIKEKRSIKSGLVYSDCIKYDLIAYQDQQN